MNAELLSKSLRALILTRDYVGEKTLPSIDGWEWYDACVALSEAIPDDSWTHQFIMRLDGICPGCKEKTLDASQENIQCKSCNWPGEHK